jgi:hypothetical protein
VWLSGLIKPRIESGLLFGILAGNLMMTNVIAYLHTTFAYQSAVMQLIVGQANFDAQALHLRETLPITVPADTNTWRVALPSEGVTARLITPNYVYQFNAGRLVSIQLKVQPHSPADSQPSLIDTNDAYQLARQWLTALSVNVSALDKYPYTVQSSTASTAISNRGPYRIEKPRSRFSGADGNRLGATNNMAPHTVARARPPIFRVTWGGGHNSQGPAHHTSPQASVEVLGATKQCLGLHISNPELFTGPPLQVTNAAALLGPLPSPQHFVEGFLGGKAAYDTVAHPDQVLAWLLTSQADGSQTKTNRTPLMAVDGLTGQSVSRALTNFDSYNWLNEKGGVPDYGVGLRFIKGTQTVDILWCAECDHLQVTYNGQSAEKDCDAARPALVRAVQTIFPNDSIIRSLSSSTANSSK